MKWVQKCRVMTFVLIIALLPSFAVAIDTDAYEEPAGGSIAFLVNPDDQIYGVSGGSGVWLTGTPVFGDYFISLFGNGIEDAIYSGVGMTFRIMPHWRIAPFIGGGGSYNYSFSQKTSEEETIAELTDTDEWPDRGDSYWAAHYEAGVRLWFRNRLQLLELMVRQTSTSLDGDRDYWLVSISTGVGL